MAVLRNFRAFVKDLHDDIKSGDQAVQRPHPASPNNSGNATAQQPTKPTTPAPSGATSATSGVTAASLGAPPIAPSTPSTPSTQWGVGYLLLAIFIDTMMSGMAFTFIPLSLATNGETSQVIGWVLGVASISTILGAPLVPWLARRFGIGRVLITAVFLNGFLILTLALSQNAVYWGVVRFITGFVIAIKWLGYEVWLNHLARVDNRGRIMALYSAANALGFGVGSGIAGYIFADGFIPYIVMVGLSGLGALPLLKMKNKKLQHDTMPKQKDGTPLNFWFALRQNPIMMLVAMAAGIMFGASGMIAVQTINHGFAPSSAAIVVALYAMGPAFLFPLVGYIVNEWSPRVIIPISGLLCAIFAWPAFYTDNYMLLVVFIVLYGTMEMTMYSSLLRSLGHDYRGQSLVAINSAIITVYSAASMVASPLAGEAMTHFGKLGLPLLMMSVGLIGLLVLFYNRRHRY